jgi:hypothetical protein
MLAKLSDLKQELLITDTSQDAYLNRILSHSSDLIQNYCNRTFAVRQVTQDIFDVENKKYIIASSYPVLRIISITVDDELLTTSDYALLSANGDGVIKPLNSTGVWNAEKITIVYKCGYNIPDQQQTDPDAKDLPMDIQRVCLDLSATQYYDRTRDPYIKSISVQDVESRTFFDRSQAGVFTEFMENVLSMYRG